MNDNYEYFSGIIEHNLGAISGTWWDAYHCKDGTPRGYKVYTKKENQLSWYYKSVGKDKEFQFEIFHPGECALNPLHIKEIAETFKSLSTPIPDWKETIEGEHYFAAKPSDSASKVTVIIKNRFGKTWKECIELKKVPLSAASIP